jgi:hypothetical protein
MSPAVVAQIAYHEFTSGKVDDKILEEAVANCASLRNGIIEELSTTLENFTWEDWENSECLGTTLECTLRVDEVSTLEDTATEFNRRSDVLMARVEDVRRSRGRKRAHHQALVNVVSRRTKMKFESVRCPGKGLPLPSGIATALAAAVEAGPEAMPEQEIEDFVGVAKDVKELCEHKAHNPCNISDAPHD